MLEMDGDEIDLLRQQRTYRLSYHCNYNLLSPMLVAIFNAQRRHCYRKSISTVFVSLAYSGTSRVVISVSEAYQW